MSRGPIRISTLRRDVGAGCLPFEGGLQAFCAFGGFVLVLRVGAFFSLSAIIRLFLHPLSWLSC